MTIGELIQLLAQYPSDLRVVEDGYDDLSPEQLVPVNIVLNTGKQRWDGKHGDPDGLTDRTDLSTWP